MLSEAISRNSIPSDPIYLAAFEGDMHRTTLDLILESFPEVAALIIGQDGSRLAGNFLIHRGGPDDLNRVFPGEISHDQGWLEGQWQIELGRVYSESDLSARSDAVAQGPVAQAFAGHKPALDCISGVVFSRTGSRQFAVEIRYPRHRENALRQPLREFLQRLARQLAFGARIAHLRRHQMETEQLVSNLLDLIPFPVVLTDGERQIDRMNARAEAMISQGRTLAVGPDQVLHAANPAYEGELIDNFGRLATCLRQRMALMAIAPQGADHHQVISLVRLNNGSIMSRASGAGMLENSTRYAVICEDLSAPPELSHEVLWRLFGLSSKEAELAISLMAGHTIGDFALRQKVSKETLRNQLATIMRKTETSRQPQLVALLTRLATVNAAV